MHRHYLVICSSSFWGNNTVVSVSLGSLAEHANKGIFRFAEETQRLLVLPAHLLPSWTLLQLQTELLSRFHHVRQAPVGFQALQGSCSSAIRAANGSSRSFPILSDAGSAKVVLALRDHDWILEVIQTNGASDFVLKVFCWICGSHDRPRSSSSCFPRAGGRIGKLSFAFVFLQSGVSFLPRQKAWEKRKEYCTSMLRH